jgi:hypothetical protein
VCRADSRPAGTKALILKLSVADVAVRALRARVVFEEDPAAPVESATVTLHLVDGTELSQHVRHGRGTPGGTLRPSPIRPD